MFVLALKPLSLFNCNVLVVFEENKIHKIPNSCLALEFEELLFGAGAGVVFSVMPVGIIHVQLVDRALQ